MSNMPRVALLADTFYEVNGAARTCREWYDFARRRDLPFLCIRWGNSPRIEEAGQVRAVDLVRSRWAFPVDPDLRFDPWFYRKLASVEKELQQFRPDVIHITSPGDLGILGAILAARLKTRLALSWHTNLHEFAARRVCRMTSWFPGGLRDSLARMVERLVMDRVCWFFGRGVVLFAPNPELIEILRSRTGKPVFPMRRGIDTGLFRPASRTRTDCDLVIGFVGRLMPEKNLGLLPRVEDALCAAGVREFHFQITGDGGERDWLKSHLRRALFTGVLKGEDLAEAYANMDIFAFPSRTDTFGNVVQEALASGVPAVVTNDGGPRFIVRHGESGFVAESDGEFCERIVLLARNQEMRRLMAAAARRQVQCQSWDNVFEEVYQGYASTL